MNRQYDGDDHWHLFWPQRKKKTKTTTQILTKLLIIGIKSFCKILSDHLFPAQSNWKLPGFTEVLLGGKSRAWTLASSSMESRLKNHRKEPVFQHRGQCSNRWKAPTWQSAWERTWGFTVLSQQVAVTLVEGEEVSGIDVVLRTSVEARSQETNWEMNWLKQLLMWVCGCHSPVHPCCPS